MNVLARSPIGSPLADRARRRGSILSSSSSTWCSSSRQPPQPRRSDPPTPINPLTPISPPTPIHPLTHRHPSTHRCTPNIDPPTPIGPPTPQLIWRAPLPNMAGRLAAARVQDAHVTARLSPHLRVLVRRAQAPVRRRRVEPLMKNGPIRTLTKNVPTRAPLTKNVSTRAPLTKI
eukprot:6998772-Prymnesium_polylepis.1